MYTVDVDRIFFRDVFLIDIFIFIIWGHFKLFIVVINIYINNIKYYENIFYINLNLLVHNIFHKYLLRASGKRSIVIPTKNIYRDSSLFKVKLNKNVIVLIIFKKSILIIKNDMHHST